MELAAALCFPGHCTASSSTPPQGFGNLVLIEWCCAGAGAQLSWHSQPGTL